MKAGHSLRLLFTVLAILVFLTGCASYGQISNLQAGENRRAVEYSIRSAAERQQSQDVILVLAFSGGGSRAAAMSYGVLQALRDSHILINGKPRRVLDEIDLISSVSGGSFTAAYYGLHGDGIFADFEANFLRHDVGGDLISRLFNPRQWFSSSGRTEMAIQYYEERVFGGATFADLAARNGPVIVINATDLGQGVRFSFLQDTFDLICSDLSSFPVARAVTASSAVPILFNPVILKNHSDCANQGFARLEEARAHVADSPQLSAVVDGLASYANKDERKFIHLVDGGLTDNLGLLAFYEAVEFSGGIREFMKKLGGKPAPKLVVISVNASTKPQYEMEQSNRAASIEDTVNAMTDAQLHTANARTLDLMQQSVRRWAEELGSENLVIDPYFIQIDFGSIADAARRRFFNSIPVGFTLTGEQVDELIRAGRKLLRENKEFERFLLEAHKLPNE